MRIKSVETTSAAEMDSVINTPELFEEILFQLPFLDLNIATGVNHTFRDFIFNSRRLQRKLFRLPATLPSSRKKKKYFDQHGVFGPFMDQDMCLNHFKKQKQVTLLPFLLEPSCIPKMQTAHLSVRAAEAYSWPVMYLTDPPCAHAYVSLTYIGIGKDQTIIGLEAGRSLYRQDGVTLAAIEEALHQSGHVTVRMGKSKNKMRSQRLQDTTMAWQIGSFQRRYQCKLKMDIAATTIKLHGIPLRSEEVPNSKMSMKGLHGLCAWGARKIRFED